MIGCCEPCKDGNAAESVVFVDLFALALGESSEMSSTQRELVADEFDDGDAACDDGLRASLYTGLRASMQQAAVANTPSLVDKPPGNDAISSSFGNEHVQKPAHKSIFERKIVRGIKRVPGTVVATFELEDPRSNPLRKTVLHLAHDPFYGVLD